MVLGPGARLEGAQNDAKMLKICIDMQLFILVLNQLPGDVQNYYSQCQNIVFNKSINDVFIYLDEAQSK